MKKIAAAFDGLKFSESTKQYAVQWAKEQNAHLTAVFLDDMTYHSYKVKDLLGEKGVLSEKRLTKLEMRDIEKRRKAVIAFEGYCKKEGIQHTLHHDKDIAIREVLHESIYADLLVLDAKETLTPYEEQLPTRFIRDILSDVHCPVILVNGAFRPIEKVVMLYDGEPTSVHAIKMFGYLFDHMRDLPVEVLSVKSGVQTMHLPDNKLMKEFMKRHFSKVTYSVLKGLPDVEIVSHLARQDPPTLVVMGAYRRGVVSRWFRTSIADVLIRELQLPVFIGDRH